VLLVLPRGEEGETPGILASWRGYGGAGNSKQCNAPGGNNVLRCGERSNRYVGPGRGHRGRGGQHPMMPMNRHHVQHPTMCTMLTRTVRV